MAADATFLGIDLGTSGVKSVLVDRDQAVLTTATVALATSRPHPGWSEQAPEDWWQAVCRSIQQISASDAGLDGVRAIGLSGQMHGLVLLNDAGAALRPAILWNDARAVDEAASFAERHPEFADIAGAAQSPSFWPAKLLWLQRYEPDCLARARHMLLPKDFIRHRLTGLVQTDPCDAGGTLLFDQAARAWSSPICAACALDPAQLPDVLEGSQPGGRVLDRVAATWGLPRGVVVAGGAGDAAAGAIGIGAVAGGCATISLGTAAQIFVSTSSWRPAAAAGVQAFAHALPGLWFQSAAVLNGASALAWATRLLGQEDPAALLDAAEAQYAGPGKLLFLPYLTGERAPHNDPLARGVLFGLTPDVAAPQLVQAVLEGVAYSLADASDALARAGTRIERAALVGGGARNAFWTRIIADTLGVPVLRYRGVDTGPAFGAARLARLAVTGEAVEAVCGAPAILDRTLPEPSRQSRYADVLVRYRNLYQAVRPLFAG